MLNVAVLVSGGGTNLQAILDAKAAGALPHAKIALVLASKPGVYALERASKASVPGIVVARKSYAAPEEYDAALLAALREHRIDVVVLAGFLSILGPSVITAYPERILNVHPSLIPSFCGAGYYGLRVHEAALAKGVKVTGATVHFVNEVPDGGRILLQQAVDVLPGDTPETLQKRVMEQAEWKLLPRALAQLTEELDAADGAPAPRQKAGAFGPKGHGGGGGRVGGAPTPHFTTANRHFSRCRRVSASSRPRKRCSISSARNHSAPYPRLNS